MERKVLVDFSNLAYTCWYPAKAAEDAGKKALQEHLAACPTWQRMVAEGNDVTDCCPALPKQYDAKLVLHTNLDLKLNTLKQVLGVDPNWFTFIMDGHPRAKYAIYPGYKGNRERDFDPKPLTYSYLTNSLTPKARFLISPNAEADDALATAAVRLVAPDREVIVVTGDKDLWSVLQFPGIKVYSPAHKAFITPDHIAKAFDGLRNPRYIALHKTLWGDTGDHVPNVVPRMQRALMPVFEKSDGTLMDFLEKTDQFDLSQRCQELLFQNLRQVVINNKLVTLDTNVPLCLVRPLPGSPSGFCYSTT